MSGNNLSEIYECLGKIKNFAFFTVRNKCYLQRKENQTSFETLISHSHSQKTKVCFQDSERKELDLRCLNSDKLLFMWEDERKTFCHVISNGKKPHPISENQLFVIQTTPLTFIACLSPLLDCEFIMSTECTFPTQFFMTPLVND